MEIRRILYPTDLSEGSANAIPYVADLTRHYDAKLYVVHVVYDISTISGLYVPHMNLDDLFKEVEVGAKEKLEGLSLEGLKGHKEVERRILKGVPHEEILRFAEDNSIDLIIIGTYSRRGLNRMIFGNTAEKVVRNSSCPVLTVGLQQK